MIEKMVFLASGGISDLLTQWEQLGMFQYILPFLVIFAVVFGILEKTKIFGDSGKPINAIISIAVGLLALQSAFVSSFFSELFPRLGVGLVVLLAGMIILGLFMEKKQGGIMFFLALIVIVVILMQTFGSVGWIHESLGDVFWRYAGIILIIVGIAVVLGLNSNPNPQSHFAGSLGGGGKP